MEPQLADNIGMVARACANFGLDSLRLVNPRDGWPNEKARIAASGANYVIDDAAAHPTLGSRDRPTSTGSPPPRPASATSGSRC